jgi:DNA-binding transcriptional LysR family regulator
MKGGKIMAQNFLTYEQQIAKLRDDKGLIVTKGGRIMIEIAQLEQLVVFADCGTLSKAAEELHISQPTLTRSMQRLEDEFRVPLFEHRKNKLILNDNGILAVEYARKTLNQANDMLEKVRHFDRSRNTLSIGSCAPGHSSTRRLRRCLPERYGWGKYVAVL